MGDTPLPHHVALSFGIALVAGLLIGLQREQANASSDHDKRAAVGGGRTFPLLALGGAAAAIAGGGPWLSAVGLLGVVALLISRRSSVGRGDGSLTSEIAAIVTWLLGTLAGSSIAFADSREKAIGVVGIAVVTATLLSVKIRLHAFVQKIRNEDIFAALQLLLAAVVVLPLLPDRTFGPYDVLNPAQVARMMVLIAGISFVGYVASRLYGAGKGMVVTGLVGGLASSTMVTFAMARRVRREPVLVDSGALAIVLASSVMLVRVVVVLAVAHAPLALRLLVPLGAAMAAALLSVCVLARRGRVALPVDAPGSPATAPASEAPSQPAIDWPLKNPLELKSAVLFGLLFSFVLFVSKVASTQAGPGALFLTAMVVGGTDVDAITLATGNLARSGTPMTVAAVTILIAATSNTVVKAGITLFVGGTALAARVGLAFAAMVAAGGVGLLLL